MKIGVFCSGGDAPGMNACIRAIVRSAISQGHQVVGINRGYQGLLEEDFYRDRDGAMVMGPRSVSDMIQTGGTMLGTSRSDEFRTVEGQKKAAAILDRHDIEALIPIGGDGTLRGAVELAKFYPGAIVSCPGTIDNDLGGTDFTIGFQTAVQTAVECLDKLRDTAASHSRLFLVEVMGRHSGYIAICTALAAGAEIACIPETPTDIREIVQHLHVLKRRGKKSVLIVVAEGDPCGGAKALQEQLDAYCAADEPQYERCPFATRSITLGHLQRGGSPVPADRILATQLGDLAVRTVIEGRTQVAAGRVSGELTLTPFSEVFVAHKPVPDSLIELVERMAH
jgi:6-phosphofructokinase 1